MSARRIVAFAATGALALGGAGVAIAAVSKDDGKKNEDAVLADAAKRLNVEPGKLRDALKAAQDAQLDKRLDEAVKNGDLTRKQADEIKKRRDESGRVLGPGGPPPGGPRMLKRFGPGPGPGGPGGAGHFRHRGGPGFGLFEDLAKAIGIKESDLFTRLRKGQTVAAIAKAEGKSLADVRSSVKSAATTRANKAVKDGDLTRKQADALIKRLDEHLKDIGEIGRHKSGKRMRMGPPPPNMRPGSFQAEPPTPAPPPDEVVIQ
jgi:hypothetical protein